MIERTTQAPIAQWIERCPPEAEAQVRVLLGVPYKTQSEHIPSQKTANFLQELTFPQNAALLRLSNKC